MMASSLLRSSVSLRRMGLPCSHVGNAVGLGHIVLELLLVKDGLLHHLLIIDVLLHGDDHRTNLLGGGGLAVELEKLGLRAGEVGVLGLDELLDERLGLGDGGKVGVTDLLGLGVLALLVLDDSLGSGGAALSLVVKVGLGDTVGISILVHLLGGLDNLLLGVDGIGVLLALGGEGGRELTKESLGRGDLSGQTLKEVQHLGGLL